MEFKNQNNIYDDQKSKFEFGPLKVCRQSELGVDFLPALPTENSLPIINPTNLKYF